MKRIFFIFTLIIFCANLFAQSNTETEIDNEELMDILRSESDALGEILEQISLLSDLLEKKFIIKKYLQEGNIEEIKRLFFIDQKIVDNLYAEHQGETMKSFNRELMTIYEGIDFVDPFLLFNNAKAHYLLKDIDKAQRLLEELVQNYPNFELLNEAILMLQEIYFKKGLHKEFISLYVKYTNKNSEIQKYWLAHSHYNIGNFEEAKNGFTELVKDSNFGLRSDEMIALISFSTEGTDSAILNFTELENKYQPNESDYSFILLSLARLYMEKGEIDKSLDYYYFYSQNHKTLIPDDILFEIGIQHKNNKRYPDAIAYFNSILNKSVKTEYYSPAKILLTISKQQSGSGEGIELGLNEIISLNDILLQTLNAKYGLMDKYEELRGRLASDDINPEKRQEELQKIEKVESMMISTNNTLNNLYSGDKITSLVAMEALEEEFIYYSVTIDMMNSVVDLANTTPNKRIPKIIDQWIDDSDVDILSLNIFSFLGHLPDENVTEEDYKIAQMLALEKMNDEQLIDTWYNIEKLAKAANHHAVERLAKQYILLMKENLNSYNILAKYSFNGAPNDDFKALISEEIKSISDNNVNLEQLKQEVILKFNKKIGERLDRQKDVLVVEKSGIKSLYEKILSGIITDVKSDKEKNEFTLLNILFNQTVALDMDYKEKDSELRQIELDKNQEKNKSE
ncbi:MAG: tetratricopeptide repeat protein [Candidatus Cloacimonetes bacterium]|nr:tetratricopeptide repeat protein [Candidatus Cloacimonadota bacterium]